MTEIPSNEPELHILESLITYKLMKLTDTILRASSQIYRARYDVSITDLRILATIGAHSPLTANSLSRLTRIDKAWISRSLVSLAERGLVLREAYAEDSRSILLTLTPKGRSLVRKMIPFAVSRHEQLLAGISRTNRAVLNELLDVLQGQAENLMPEPDTTAARPLRVSTKKKTSPPDKTGKELGLATRKRLKTISKNTT